ncbi:MAG: DUF1554 domain-containing protein, partial [Leptospira sp.]|nr:DUF1554 domain-containing protein [Leptospira sp.]
YILGDASPQCGFYTYKLPSFITNPSGNFTSETGKSITIGVRLSDPPSEVVDVSVNVSSNNEARLSATYMQFNQNNWNKDQVVTLAGLDDNAFDLNQLYYVQLKGSSKDDAFNNIQKALPFTNNDNERKIFVTSVAYLGSSLGFVSGADAKCNADPNKPSDTLVYKALIVDNSGCNGIPCRRASFTANTGDSQIDWVLSPDSDFYRTDKTTFLFRSNANGIFVFGNFTNPMTPGAFSVWTGISGNWTTFVASDCTNWNGGGSGTQGNTSLTASGSLSGAGPGCGGSANLICVQQ